MDKTTLILKFLKPRRRKKKGIIHYQLRFSLNFGEERAQDMVEPLHFSLYSHTHKTSVQNLCTVPTRSNQTYSFYQVGCSKLVLLVWLSIASSHYYDSLSSRKLKLINSNI